MSSSCKDSTRFDVASTWLRCRRYHDKIDVDLSVNAYTMAGAGLLEYQKATKVYVRGLTSLGAIRGFCHNLKDVQVVASYAAVLEWLSLDQIKNIEASR